MRFRALDAWRGVCALMIALLHFCIQEWPVVCGFCDSPFLTSSWLFVDFFFVLSGFVIAHAYGDRLGTSMPFLVFAIRRFGRLWPLHAVMLVSLAALRLLAPILTTGSPAALPLTGRQSLASFLLDVPLLRSAGLAAFEPAWHLDWNYPSWSIGAELYGCLLFAIIAVLVRPAPLRRAVEGGVALACAAILALAVGDMDATDDYGLLRCLYGFLLGRLLYEAWRRRRSRTLAMASALEVAVVAAVVCFVTFNDHRPITLAAPLLFGAAIYVFAHEQGAISRMLRTPVPQRLGELSYSVYMVHVFAYELILRVLHPALRWTSRQLGRSGEITGGVAAGAAEVAIAMILVVGIASVTYACVEQPGRGYFNALARQREKRTTASAASSA